MHATVFFIFPNISVSHIALPPFTLKIIRICNVYLYSKRKKSKPLLRITYMFGKPQTFLDITPPVWFLPHTCIMLKLCWKTHICVGNPIYVWENSYIFGFNQICVTIPWPVWFYQIPETCWNEVRTTIYVWIMP